MSGHTPWRKALLCAMCGRPVKGHAYIGDLRYCHGDDDQSPTCYEGAQLERQCAGIMQDLDSLEMCLKSAQHNATDPSEHLADLLYALHQHGWRRDLGVSLDATANMNSPAS